MAKWVLQRQGRGWITDAEGTYAEMQKEYVSRIGNGFHNTYRIREKIRKPRKNCSNCKGTGQYETWDGRGDSCFVRCECLSD